MPLKYERDQAPDLLNHAPGEAFTPHGRAPAQRGLA